MAVGVALGVKLTVILVLPVFVLLAAIRGVQRLAWFVGSTFVFGLLLAGPGLLRNLIHTGRLLGHGGGRTEHEWDGWSPTQSRRHFGSAIGCSTSPGWPLLGQHSS